MELRSLLQKHNETLEKIKSLNKIQETRALSGAEDKELESLFTEGTKLKKDIEQRERIRDLQLNQSELIPERERREYSLSNALKALATGRALSGYEAEVQTELEKRGARSQNGQGVLIPTEDFFRGKRLEKRVVNAQSALISDPIKPSEFLPALYEKSVIDRLGIKRITATGKFTFPKAGTVASGWFDASGTGSLVEGDTAFTSGAVEPHYLGIITGWSLKQVMEMTADLSLESLLRDSITQSMAEKLDESLIIADGASNTPMGLRASIPSGNNTALDLSASDAAWKIENLTDEKRNLKQAYKNNAMMPKWLINPTIESEWESTQKFSGSVSEPLAKDGMACGMPYLISNHLKAKTAVNSVEVLLGDFSEFMVTTFQAVEISLGMIDDDFKKGIQRLRAILACDMTILRQEAFRKITIDRTA